jgi:hypothetical protein
MGKSAPDAIRAGKVTVARVVDRAMRAVYHGIGKRSKEDMQAAFNMPQAEAPMWAHTSSKLAVAEVRANLNENQTPNTALNLIMIGRADTVGAWEAMAQPFQRPMLGEKPKAIDVPVVAKEEATKK